MPAVSAAGPSLPRAEAALRAVGGAPCAGPLQSGPRLLARDRLAERRHRQLRRAHDGRPFANPLQGFIGLAAEYAREVHSSLAAAGAWAASLERIPAASIATTAPAPHATSSAVLEARNASIAPATTAATVAAARHRRYGASTSRTSGCSPLRGTNAENTAVEDSRTAMAGPPDSASAPRSAKNSG